MLELLENQRRYFSSGATLPVKARLAALKKLKSVILARENDINEALKAAQVVPDFRYPNVIRLAPSPLYTSFEEVWELVRRLKEIMDTRAFEKYSDKAGTVA